MHILQLKMVEQLMTDGEESLFQSIETAATDASSVRVAPVKSDDAPPGQAQTQADSRVPADATNGGHEDDMSASTTSSCCNGENKENKRR